MFQFIVFVRFFFSLFVDIQSTLWHSLQTKYRIYVKAIFVIAISSISINKLRHILIAIDCEFSAFDFRKGKNFRGKLLPLRKSLFVHFAL